MPFHTKPKTREQVRDELLTQIRQGFLTTETEWLKFIRDELDLDVGAAQQFLDTVVRPQLQPDPGAIVESDDPLGIYSSVGRDPLLEEQQQRAQYLRGILGATGRAVGGFGPLSQRALRTSFGSFSDIDPITRETGGLGLAASEPGQRFQDFLTGPQATPQSLAEALRGFTGSVAPGSDAFAGQSFRGRFSDAGAALRAAIQPYLLTVNPRQRAAAAQNLINTIEPQISMNPQAFESDQQIAALMQEILGKSGFGGQPVESGTQLPFRR